MNNISSNVINEDTIIKSSSFFTLKTYINISMIKMRIHHLRKHEQKEIMEKTYHGDFL